MVEITSDKVSRILNVTDFGSMYLMHLRYRFHRVFDDGFLQKMPPDLKKQGSTYGKIAWYTNQLITKGEYIYIYL